MFDIFYLSYYDVTADSIFKKIQKLYPHANHIKNIKGIYPAHKACANKSITEMFYVIDGDSKLLNYKFDYIPNKKERNYVHVWRAKNAVNGLVYGYGGIKLFPKKIFDTLEHYIDMTSTITKHLKRHDEVASITEFNKTAFDSWKAGFREATKLSSKIIDRQVDNESNYRLNVWMTKGHNKKYGKYCVEGAILGNKYGLKHKNDFNKLSKINDFDWLEKLYNTIYRNVDEN